MSSPRVVPPAADLSPEAFRRYLVETARRELDALRAALDTRLAALEAALSQPDPNVSLEELVLELARVATAEAESSAEKACLEAQLDVEQRAAVAASEMQHLLGAERDRTSALRLELEQTQADREAERAASAERIRELERTQADLLAAHGAEAESRRGVEEARRALQDERAKRAALDEELVQQRAAQLRMSEAGAAVQRELAGLQHIVQTRAAEVNAHRSAVDALDRRVADLDRALRDSVVRTQAASRERDGFAAALEAEREQASAGLAAVNARIEAIDAEHAAAGRAREEAEARADRADAECATLTAALEAARQAVLAGDAALDAQRHATASAPADALEAAEARATAAVVERNALLAELNAVRRSAKADADAQHVRSVEAAAERIRALELQLFHRERGAHDRDVDLGALLNAPPLPADSASRETKRHGFSATAEVQIDGEAGVLVDLSVGGAQVFCPTEFDVDRVVTITLPSDELPVTCQGRIVWSRREPHSKRRLLKYRAGILFTAADAAAINAFIVRYATS